jgi:hypothetical protein
MSVLAYLGGTAEACQASGIGAISCSSPPPASPRTCEQSLSMTTTLGRTKQNPFSFSRQSSPLWLKDLQRNPPWLRISRKKNRKMEEERAVQDPSQSFSGREQEQSCRESRPRRGWAQRLVRLSMQTCTWRSLLSLGSLGGVCSILLHADKSLG